MCAVCKRRAMMKEWRRSRGVKRPLPSAMFAAIERDAVELVSQVAVTVGEGLG